MVAAPEPGGWKVSTKRRGGRVKRVHWCYHAGQPFVNRVAVREGKRGSISMTWVENGRDRRKHTGTRVRFKAMCMAENKAAELLARLPKTYRPEAEIIAIRADLLRVGRLCGQAEGVAPSPRDYVKHGTFSVSRVQSAFSGYEQRGRYYQPVDGWTTVVKKFGLRCAAWDRATERDLLIDLRRVALSLGKPLDMPSSKEYEQRGRWGHNCVRRHFKGMSWPEIGDRAGLATSARRRAMSELNRARAHEQQSGPKRSAA